MNALEKIETGAVLTQKQTDDIRLAAAFDALSMNTRRAYQKSYDRLGKIGIDVESLTDAGLDIVVRKLAESVSHGTLAITVAAVKWYHKNVLKADRSWSITADRLKVIKRDSLAAPGRGQVAGLAWNDVEKACAYAEATGGLAGLRDAAMIRLMSDCLLRISEIVAVNIEDLKDETLLVRRSKTDQLGDGENLYITRDTRKAIKAYLDAAGFTTLGDRGFTTNDQAIFCHIRKGSFLQFQDRLTPESARRIIHKRATAAGVEGFISGHSLRVGSAVSLAKAGASLVDMQVAGRWTSSQMPAHYAKAEIAARGAIARFKEGRV